MKQKNLFKISALFLAAVAWIVPANAEEQHHHEHDENCAHDHDEKNSHETHEHVHGENCSHDHEHAEHSHDEHAACDEHDHAHGAHDSHAHSHDETVITISDRARRSIALATEKVSDTPVVSAKSYYGQMMVPPAAVETSALTANGSVRFFVRAGQKVSAGTPLYAVASPELVELSWILMREIQAAARSRGCEISDDHLQKQFDVTARCGAYLPSSLLDFRAGREVEIESIWGEPLRRGTANGIPMPHLETLYLLLKTLCAKKKN
ncbi:MAG: hypothetical protein IJX22_04600 [Opitutales bacterium]|nr:hypothetical protein [Opitutales bacterium]